VIYLENPQDWAFQKIAEKNNPNSYKKDYSNANINPKQLALSTVSGMGVVYFLGNLVYNGTRIINFIPSYITWCGDILSLTILNNIFCHSVYILRYGVLIYE
jgi:hypothetical protein